MRCILLVRLYLFTHLSSTMVPDGGMANRGSLAVDEEMDLALLVRVVMDSSPQDQHLLKTNTLSQRMTSEDPGGD